MMLGSALKQSMRAACAAAAASLLVQVRGSDSILLPLGFCFSAFTVLIRTIQRLIITLP